MKPTSRTTALVLSLLLVALSSTSGKQVEEPFASVPNAIRARLVTRLELFVRYHREHQWGLVYDMLAHDAKSGAASGPSRQRFLQDKLYSSAIRFTPRESSQTNAGQGFASWTILGCAEFERVGPNQRMESGLDATWNGEDWYFSDIWTTVDCVDCGTKPCGH